MQAAVERLTKGLVSMDYQIAEGSQLRRAKTAAGRAFHYILRLDASLRRGGFSLDRPPMREWFADSGLWR